MGDRFTDKGIALGEVIRSYREELSISQENLSDLTGISSNTLSYIENGVKDTRLATLDRIAEAFGTTAVDVLDRRDQRLRDGEASSPEGSSATSPTKRLTRHISTLKNPSVRVTKAMGAVSYGGLFAQEQPEHRNPSIPDDPSDADAAISWLADGLLEGYMFDIVAMVGSDGRRYPLPTESAAMANMLETTLVEHLQLAAEHIDGIVVELPRSTRVYPDIAFTGAALDDEIIACDIKVARREPANPDRTQSRITLYTGNTYFKDPVNNTQNIMRPFNQYALHLDCVAFYDFVTEPSPAVTNVELVIVEPWRIGSHQRSSGTRNYIGAITSIPDIRAGRGEFGSKEEFYSFWRAYEGWNTSSKV